MKIFTILRGFSWPQESHVFRWVYKNNKAYIKHDLKDVCVGFRIIKTL